MIYWTAVLVFFFGTIIGSFLNVVIYRFNSGKTLGGRSMCFSCGKTLHWYELVPLASFIVQRGRCVKCRSVISSQYPIVEALTGIIFVALAFKLFPLLLISTTVFVTFLTVSCYLWCIWLVISVYDIRHTIIPEQLVWSANIVALLSLCIFSNTNIVFHLPALNELLAGPLLALPFWALWYGSKGKWMGLGDAKLMLGLGWFLGIAIGFAGMLLAFWIGAFFAIILLALKHSRYTMKSEIPFGPFLVLGAFVAYILSLDLVAIVSIFS